MQIGAFARECGVEVSLLRYYDQIGLLKPVYTDPMTGYRHYSNTQADIYRTITLLRECGLTLAHIKRVLDGGDITAALRDKSREFSARLKSLHKVTNNIGGDKMKGITLSDISVATKIVENPENANETEQFTAELHENGFQLISQPEYIWSIDGICSLKTEVVKLSARGTVPCRNDDLSQYPFEDDPPIIGKWQVCGYYPTAVPAHVLDKLNLSDPVDPSGDGLIPFRIICFLPNGQQYWCFSWTKGLVKYSTGDPVSTANSYHFVSTESHEYLYVHLKDYQYVYLGGHPKWMILRRLDSNAYTLAELARKDEINLPFEDDPYLRGEWRAADFVNHPDMFDGTNPFQGELFWRSVHFQADGTCEADYGGKRVTHKWTRGMVLDTVQSLCERIEQRNIAGRDYFFIQWKNGDYIYGGREPWWYVFSKA